MNSTDLTALAIGTFGLSPIGLAGIVAASLLTALFLLILSIHRAGRSRAEIAMDAARREAVAEARLAELLRAQAEMQGRLAAMSDVFGKRQSELNQTINQRLDGLTQRLGTTITEQTKIDT